MCMFDLFPRGCAFSSRLCFVRPREVYENPAEKERESHILLQLKDLNSQHVISSQPWLQCCTDSLPATFQLLFDVHDRRKSQCVYACDVCVCVISRQGHRGCVFMPLVLPQWLSPHRLSTKEIKYLVTFDATLTDWLTADGGGM